MMMTKKQQTQGLSAVLLSGALLLISAMTPAWAEQPKYQRIVSATGNISEALFMMGLKDNLVAVDTTSPKMILDKKPNIGYRRHLSAEGILSMQPDLLILAPDAGPPVVIEQLKAANIPTLTIEDKKSIDGVVADISLVANKLGIQKPAQALIKAIRADEKAVNQLIAGYSAVPKMAFLMDGGTGQNRIMALGADSAGDAMIDIVGGSNVFAKDFKSIKPVSTESMIATDMDMIIIAAHGKGLPTTDSIDNATADYANLSLTKAAQKNCVFRVATIKTLGFGPEVAKAAKAIAEKVAECIK